MGLEAVGGFFVPIWSLFRPYQVMKEVYAGSMSLSRSQRADSQKAELPPIVGWWWALFLISSFLDNASGRLMLRAEEFNEVLSSAYLVTFADLFNLPAAFCPAARKRGDFTPADHKRSNIANTERRVITAQQAVFEIDYAICGPGGLI